jgi:hypothetical protein
MSFGIKKKKEGKFKMQKIILEPLETPKKEHESLKNFVFMNELKSNSLAKLNPAVQNYIEPILSPPATKKSQFVPSKSSFRTLERKSNRKIDEQSKDFPPHIRKLENFWIKLGSLENKIKTEFSSPEPSVQKFQSSKNIRLVKNKLTGVPARFQQVSSKEIRTNRNFNMDYDRIRKDIKIIKASNSNELKQRLDVAKLVRNYEENSPKDGILKNKVLEESWKWHTPGSTPVNKSVHFDI